jgi:hypothetical protein
LREEHRVRVVENTVLKIFELKRSEVTRELRGLHNEELYDLYSFPNIVSDQVKKDVMGREFSMCGGGEVCQVLMVKPEGERPLLRHA